jgi:N-acyl-D-amino-acid deacylase
VVDGTGAAPTRADVAIASGRIEIVGDLGHARAARRLDVAGAVVGPGLIDVHVHSEVELLRAPVHEAGLLQGVTTHVLGQDGFGFAPTTPDTASFMSDYLAGLYGATEPLAPGTLEAFLARYDRATTVNVATLVPAGCVRMNAMGSNAMRAPTPAEVEAMREECRRGMEAGALGLSSGLDYVPGGYATTDELVALCEAVAPYGGVYVTHIRNRLGLENAVGEAIEIGRRAGVPVQISHLFGGETVLELLRGARAGGVDVTFDTYPYTYGSTLLAFPLPLWMLEGSFEEVLARLANPGVRERVRAELGSSVESWSQFTIGGDHRLAGLDVLTAAGAADPVDFLCDLLFAERLAVLLVGAPDDAAHETMLAMLLDPAHLACSDGIYRSGRIHPRAFGAFARFLRSQPLPEAIRHATSAAARRFGLADRGELAPGFAADVIVFDPDAVADAATPDHPRAPARGMRHVVVNGELVLEDGRPTGRTPGRALRRG